MIIEIYYYININGLFLYLGFGQICINLVRNDFVYSKTVTIIRIKLLLFMKRVIRKYLIEFNVRGAVNKVY